MPQRHRPDLSESVSGEAPVTYRRLPRTFRPGRTCAVAGCPTVLSIYNGGKHCSVHSSGPLRAATVTLAPETMAQQAS
jgi:hypothetical protein